MVEEAQGKLDRKPIMYAGRQFLNFSSRSLRLGVRINQYSSRIRRKEANLGMPDL